MQKMVYRRCPKNEQWEDQIFLRARNARKKKLGDPADEAQDRAARADERSDMRLLFWVGGCYLALRLGEAGMTWFGKIFLGWS